MTEKISKQIPLLLFFLLTSSVLFSQINITGVVVDTAGIEIPDVSLHEMYTTNGTTTDISGKFSLTVSDTALIQFAFIFYKDTIIPANKLSNETVKLELRDDYDDIIFCPVDYAGTFSVGYYGDINNLPYGMNLYVFRPQLFRIPVLLFINAYYKTNFESDYDLKLKLTRSDVIKNEKYSLNLGLEYQNRQLNLSDFNYQVQDYQITFTNSFQNIISFAPGLVYREEKRIEQEYHLGYYLSLFKSFNNIGQTVSVNLTYFGDYSEYSCAIYQKLSINNWFLSRFQIGLIYSGYREYNDFSILFRYVLTY
jgi:hypothetical protein